MENLQTAQQYDTVFGTCREIFKHKTLDYGTSWRILRPSSITDQIFIKASRIRTIQEKGRQEIEEAIDNEFKGIINYCVMGLIQMKMGTSDSQDLNLKESLAAYDEQYQKAKLLMEKKNHDYGEAWRSMRLSSITDLILQKLLRVKQIEDNEGATLVSEGLDANYLDMINYAVFALILINETA